MRLTNLLKTTALTALLVIAGKVGMGQVTLPHYDGFDYTVGQALQTQTNWSNVNTGDDISIASGSLTYSGLKTSTGNKISFGSSGIDAYKAITNQTTGTIYYSFILNVTGLNTLNATGGYFTGFGQNTTTFGATVWTGLDGAGYKIGINPRTSTTTNMVWVTGTQTLNNPVFVVVSYTFNAAASDDVVNIWVNPSSTSFGSATEPTVSATATNATGTDLTGIAQIFIRQDSDTETPAIEMDELRVGTTWADVTPIDAPDTQTPVATFVPAGSATDVAINSPITISFNEAIRNIDNSEITNANVASLLTLKEKVSGNATAFAATIDAAKKVITITPSANLSNSLEYEVAIAPVEDVSDNATVLQSSTFTTIASTTPAITLTYPNGGEKFYAGQEVTFTWTSANMSSENVKIEAYVKTDATTWGWVEAIASVAASAGTANYTIPADARYGTDYKIRVTGLTSSVFDESDATFKVIPVVSNIAAYKALTAGTVAKISGEVVISFIRTANRNQKYVQDATGGILVDDPTPATITTTYVLNDGITGLEGTLTMYGTYTYELVPTVDPGASTSTGNTITPTVITLTQLNADHIQYQSMLVKVEGVTIKEADGTVKFAASSASSNYTMQKGTDEAVVRQAWKTGETDLIDAVIPTGSQNIVGIVGQYTTGGTTTAQLQPRTLSDISPVTGIGDNFDSNLTVYPNPFTNEIRFNGTDNVKRVIVTSITGQVLKNVAVGSVSSIDTQDLPQGMYIVTFTNDKGAKSTIKMIKQ